MNMDSEKCSQERPRVFFRLILPVRVPSLNHLFALNCWQRLKLKKQIHAAVFLELSRIGHVHATQIISARNGLSTRSDTPESSKNPTPQYRGERAQDRRTHPNLSGQDRALKNLGNAT